MFCAVSHASYDSDSELISNDLIHFTPIAEGVRRASSLTLYEGLPHPTWEGKQYESELATKKIIRFHGFPFYERPLAVAADEIEPLRRLCAAADSYWSYRGPKSCGGYHPDYCLVWNDGETAYHLLICFGCNEMKLYGPKNELIVDIRHEAVARFKAALERHRDQRPKAE
jgi:hypothetical protein